MLRSPDYSADRSSFFISRMPNLDLRLLARFDREPTLKFATLVAQALPSLVLADLFEIPGEHREDFYAWSNNMTQFFGDASRYRNENGVDVNRSAVSIRDYFRKLIARRRTEPGGDSLSILLRFQGSLGLTDSEVVSQAVMMLVAGQITTTDQMNNNLYALPVRLGGAKLARIQMGSLFGQMLRRYPELALEPERPAVRKHHSLAFSGFESIPLRIGSRATIHRAASAGSRI